MEIAQEERPDLIPMDIQRPGLSGMDVTRRPEAKRNLREIPVIAVTAFAAHGGEDRVRACGCEDYLSKPISIRTLIETTLRHIE